MTDKAQEMSLGLISLYIRPDPKLRSPGPNISTLTLPSARAQLSNDISPLLLNNLKIRIESLVFVVHMLERAIAWACIVLFRKSELHSNFFDFLNFLWSRNSLGIIVTIIFEIFTVDKQSWFGEHYIICLLLCREICWSDDVTFKNLQNSILLFLGCVDGSAVQIRW